MGTWEHMPTKQQGPSTTSGLALFFARLAVAAIIVPVVVVTTLVYIGWIDLALIIGSIAFVIIVGSRLSDPFARAVKRFGDKLGLVIGGLLRRLLLIPFFLFVMAPLAWLQRRRKIDVLERELDPQADSYWKPVKPSTSYERTY